VEFSKSRLIGWGYLSSICEIHNGWMMDDIGVREREL